MFHSLRFAGLFSSFSVLKTLLSVLFTVLSKLYCSAPPHRQFVIVAVDYSGGASGARRAKKRSSGESPGDGQTLRSSGRQTTARVKRTNNPPPGQVQEPGFVL